MNYAINRYKYQDVDLPWLNTRPTPNTPATKKPLLKSKKAVTEATFPLTLNSAVTATVQRPKVSRNKKEKEEEEEVLVVDGIEFEKDGYIKFDVYINTPEHEGVGPGASEFAGSFVNVPHKHHHSKTKMTMVTKLRLGITDLLEDLKAEDDESVLVTLVPRAGKVKIGGLGIEFSS